MEGKEKNGEEEKREGLVLLTRGREGLLLKNFPCAERFSESRNGGLESTERLRKRFMPEQHKVPSVGKKGLRDRHRSMIVTHIGGGKVGTEGANSL